MATVEGERTPIRDKTGQNLQRRQPGVGQKIESSQRGHAAHSSQRAIYSECPPLHAGMAELADAADSKSAGPCGHGGSTPPPGTSLKCIQLQQFAKWQNRLRLICAQVVPRLPLSGVASWRVELGVLIVRRQDGDDEL